MSKKPTPTPKPVLRILDGNDIAWIWDGEWLDIDYSVTGEKRDLDSGYPASTFSQVHEIIGDTASGEQWIMSDWTRKRTPSKPF